MIQTWVAQSGVLKRRGHSDQIGGFYAFTPGTVKPLGYKDELLGAGTRNVGPRIDPATLTVHVGDYVLSSGEEVSGLDIHGSITTAAALATPAYVHDCIVRGNPGTTSQAGIVLGHNFSMSGTVFEWCRFDATGNEKVTVSLIDMLGRSDVIASGEYSCLQSISYNTASLPRGIYVVRLQAGTETVTKKIELQ